MNVLDHVEIRILDLIEEKERLSHRLHAIENSLEVYKAKLIEKQAKHSPLPVSALIKTSEETKKTDIYDEVASKLFSGEKDTIESDLVPSGPETVELETPKEEKPKKGRRGRPAKEKTADPESKYTPPPSPHKLKHLSKKAADKKVEDFIAEDSKTDAPVKTMRSDYREIVKDPADDGMGLLADLFGEIDVDVRQKEAPEIDSIINNSGEVLLDPKNKKDITTLIREIALKSEAHKKALNENLKSIIGYDTFASIPDDENITTEIWYSISEWSKTL